MYQWNYSDRFNKSKTDIPNYNKTMADKEKLGKENCILWIQCFLCLLIYSASLSIKHTVYNTIIVTDI